MDEFRFLPGFFIARCKLALITTIILFIIAIPISWYLANTKSPLKPLFETLLSLPIVLPPSVLDSYILVFFPKILPIWGLP